jgi:aspartyl-tRNA(Asn)/glutamyl-tRNA(Gln) amidotransferase subunit C
MFSNEQTLQIAKLARLRLSDEEVELYGNQLGSILGYVEKLQELDTENVPELQHAAQLQNVFRDDVVNQCSEESRKRALDNFSNREGDLLKVQAVFENRTE